MLLELGKRGSLLRLRLEAEANKLSELKANIFGEGEVQVADLLFRLGVASRFERWLTCHEFKGKDAKAPDVDGPVVHLCTTTLDHLRRQVVQSAAHSGASVRRSVHTPPEVSQLDRAQAVQQIFRLDVPVDYVLRVDVLQGLDHLPDVVCCLDLGVAALCPQIFVELTLRAILQDQVNLVVIEEEAVELNNVRVAQVALDLNLPPKLVLNATLQQLLLVEHFQRD